MSEEATWLHLRVAHGLHDWTDDELRQHYPELISPDGAPDVAGLHAHDHRVSWDLEHDHEGVTPNETP